METMQQLLYFCSSELKSTWCCLVYTAIFFTTRQLRQNDENTKPTNNSITNLKTLLWFPDKQFRINHLSVFLQSLYNKKYPDQGELKLSFSILPNIFYFLCSWVLKKRLIISSMITGTYRTRSRIRNFPIVSHPLCMRLFYCSTLHVFSFWENLFYSG